jgi:hypothetical protein
MVAHMHCHKGFFYDDVKKFLIEIIKAISNIRSLTDCEGIKVYS